MGGSILGISLPSFFIGIMLIYSKRRRFIGGLHLLNAGPERLDATVAFLHECAPDFLLPCHCTGAQVIERLHAEFGDAVLRAGGAGQTIDI